MRLYDHTIPHELRQSPMSLLPDLLGSFNLRHDQRSSERQRTIATLAFFVNVVLLVLYEVATRAWGWHFSIGPVALSLGLSLWLVSLVLLLIASSAYRAVMSFVQGLGSGRGDKSKLEPTFLFRHRRFIFYPGTFLNVAAICVLVEESGGVIRSPFTPVLLAIMLGAQQLGRFSTNSKIFISLGIVLTAALFGFEAAAGLRQVPSPPPRLVFLLLASSFLLAALCGHVDKPPNYKATGTFPGPKYVEVYTDKNGVWRYSVHSSKSHFDPIIAKGGPPAIDAAKKQAEKRLQETLQPAGEASYKITWDDSARGDESVGTIESRQPSASPTGPG